MKILTTLSDYIKLIIPLSDLIKQLNKEKAKGKKKKEAILKLISDLYDTLEESGYEFHLKKKTLIKIISITINIIVDFYKITDSFKQG